MKIKINGRDVEAQQVSFSSLNEPWAEYHLEDGSIVRIKTVMTRIYKTEERNADGSIIYSFNTQQVAVVDEKVANA